MGKRWIVLRIIISIGIIIENPKPFTTTLFYNTVYNNNQFLITKNLKK